MARKFSELRDRILADPIRAVRLERVRAAVRRVYSEHNPSAARER
jgi:hypothetical protein